MTDAKTVTTPDSLDARARQALADIDTISNILNQWRSLDLNQVREDAVKAGASRDEAGRFTGRIRDAVVGDLETHGAEAITVLHTIRYNVNLTAEIIREAHAMRRRYGQT